METSYYNISYLEHQLIQLYEKEKMRLALYRQELRQLPKGTLIIRQNVNGNYYFCEKLGESETGITKKKKHTERLARKIFLEQRIVTVEHGCKILAGVIKRLKRQRVQNQNKRNKTFQRLPVVFPEKRYQYSRKALAWMEAPYERNPFHPEQLIYKTKSGIMVRSKSERMIADFLTEHGIPFRYEAKLLIDGRVFYPDFTILCEDGALLLWEHFGLMDQDAYFNHACEKIKAYRKKGYMQHTNLICTWEEDLLQAEQLEKILERFGVGNFSISEIDRGEAA